MIYRMLLLLTLSTSTALAASHQLNFFTWPEYIDPDIITQFEEEFDCDVTIDYFDSNEEALGKLQAAGTGLYDLVVPTTYAVPLFIEAGLLAELDHAQIPNLTNLYDRFINPSYDPDNTYTAAYQWGTTGLAYRTDMVDAPPTSWDVIFSADNDLPFAMIDDMRPMIGSALVYLGFDYNSEAPEELKAAREVLISAKERSSGFYGSVAGRNLLINGDVAYAIVYTGDALQAADENENISYVVPEEGAEIWVDSLAILKDAPNADMAHAFINYILEPEIGAQLTNWTYYPTPNEAALPFLDQEVIDNPIIFLSEEEQARLSYTEDITSLELYDLIWTQVKSR